MKRKIFSSRRLLTASVAGIAAAFIVWHPTAAFAAMSDSGTDALKYMPVQDAGRLKPFDTFARESMQLVYGAQEYHSASGGERSAVEIVMTWMLVPQYWEAQKIVKISHKGLKDSLKLDENEKYFTPNDLMSNPRVSLVLQELADIRQTKQKLNPYYQAVQTLENQLGLLHAIKTGEALRVAPPRAAAKFGPKMTGDGPSSEEPDKWTAVTDLQGDLKDKFAAVVSAFVSALPSPETAGHASPPASQESLATAVHDFITAARAQNPEMYPSEKVISIEVHDQSLHPFMWAWILYLLTALTLAFAWHLGSPILYRLGWFFGLAAFLMHTSGFALRMYLMGRPPVSNMYESVVWVSWGCVAFSMVFEAIYRRRFILLAGSAVAVLCLIVADMAPAILDSRMDPLEPVLRSNYWLTIHVLTITLSYSAYFLAWGLGNIGLGFILRGDKPTGERVRNLVQTIYRAIQVGVVLLASGIILGGIWADYSWGRFWGWDPKETWALIALLGYVAILHGRLVGWVQNFGMMVGAVVGFNLVLMAWYGVNYVLGAGLHSYGFGAGGVQYVAGFIVLNLIYVGYVAYIRRAQRLGLHKI